jgi:hypothetical protein
LINFTLGDYTCRFKQWHHLIGDDPNIKDYANYELTPALIQNVVYQMNTDKLLFGKLNISVPTEPPISVSTEPPFRFQLGH